MEVVPAAASFCPVGEYACPVAEYSCPVTEYFRPVTEYYRPVIWLFRTVFSELWTVVLRGRTVAITNTADGGEDFRIGGVVFDQAAEADDEIVDGTRVGVLI